MREFDPSEVKWLPADENDFGIETIGIAPYYVGEYKFSRIVGYNGILEGDEVYYKGKKWSVVMVSRLGDFGLFRTGDLPYEVRVRPKEVTRA